MLFTRRKYATYFERMAYFVQDVAFLIVLTVLRYSVTVLQLEMRLINRQILLYIYIYIFIYKYIDIDVEFLFVILGT